MKKNITLFCEKGNFKSCEDYGDEEAYDLLDKNSDLVKISAGSSAGKEAKTERPQSRGSAAVEDYPDHGKALPNERLAIVPAEEVSDETVWIINEPDACKDKVQFEKRLFSNAGKFRRQR